MRLGSVETAVLSLLIPSGGVLDVGTIKNELSGFSRLSGEMDAGVLRRIRSVHNSIARSLRSLASKGLILKDGWIVRLLWENVAVELIHRTSFGRQVLGDS